MNTYSTSTGRSRVVDERRFALDRKLVVTHVNSTCADGGIRVLSDAAWLRRT